MKKLIYLFLVIFFIACSKTDVAPLDSSIFGIYIKESSGGLWWENAIGSTLIKVSPGDGKFIMIITNYNSLYPAFTFTFDSVKLAADNSFTVDQIIHDSLSSTKYSKATGNGNFGVNEISLNFFIYREGSIGSETIQFAHVKKIQ